VQPLRAKASKISGTIFFMDAIIGFGFANPGMIQWPPGPYEDDRGSG
jgi:hypothetical protein